MKILYYRHIFWKSKCWKRLNSPKWTPEKNWNFFDSWKLIPPEYNFMTRENKYLRKIVLLRQLDIYIFHWKHYFKGIIFYQCFFQYGWEKTDETKTLRPIMLPTGIKSASDELIKIISCGWTGKSLIWYNTSMVFSSLSSLFIIFHTIWEHPKVHTYIKKEGGLPQRVHTILNLGILLFTCMQRGWGSSNFHFCAVLYGYPVLKT